MSLEHTLLSVPPEQWNASQSVVFDWYDGPREGLCQLVDPPAEFYFELLDERSGDDDLDDRLLRLSAVPAGSVAAVLSALKVLGEPAGPVWVPVWRFPSEEARVAAEARLQEVEAAKQPTPLVVHTRDLVAFLGCWQVDVSAQPGVDWFAELNVGRKRPA